MHRGRLKTHIGFGGHYHLVDHIGHVQLDDEPLETIIDNVSVDSDLTNDDQLSDTSISDRVSDFETARKIEETLAKFPEARKRAEKAYISKRSFSTKTESTPSNLFTRNDNFAQALSSVLKLCVEENAQEQIGPSVNAASHPGTGTTVLPTIHQQNHPAENGNICGDDLTPEIEKLRHTTIKAKIDERHGRIRVQHVDVSKILSANKDDQCKTRQVFNSNRPKNDATSAIFSSSKKNFCRPTSAIRHVTANNLAAHRNQEFLDKNAVNKTTYPVTQPSTPIISNGSNASRSIRKEVKFVDALASNAQEVELKVNNQAGMSSTAIQAIPPQIGDHGDTADDSPTEEEDDIQATRQKMKQLGNKLQFYRSHKKPITFSIKEELNLQHANMNEIMEVLLEKSCNRLSDEKRLYLEESVLVVNGFNALDSNSDGLLSRTDFEMFFKKRKGKPPADEIDRIMWLLDDNRRGYLALQDVQNYYFRVLHMFCHWTPMMEMEKHYAILSKKELNASIRTNNVANHQQRPSSASPRKLKAMTTHKPCSINLAESGMHANNSMEDNNRYSLAVLRNAMECFTESVFLYRLILFAALENNDREVHVLSALQQMVERFGPEVADRKFEQLFCRSAIDLQDSELLTLNNVLGNAKIWDQRYERFKVPLSAREKGDIYIQYRNSELERQIRSKAMIDELDQLEL